MKNTVSKLDHINFTVSNFEESVRWYKTVFQFKLVEKGVNLRGNQWGILKSGDTMLAIAEDSERKQNDSDEFHRIYHFGLRLVDSAEWEQTLKENKLKTYYASPITYPHSTSWYVKDPTGNEIEVAVWKNNQVQFS